MSNMAKNSLTSKEEKDRILVRLEKDLSEKVRKAAVVETRSINSFIVNALKAYLAWKFDSNEKIEA